MTKLCGKCFENKTVDNFIIKNKKTGTYTSYCRDCNKAYQKEHYKRNKETYRNKASKYKKSNRDLVRSLKSKLHCNRCSESETCCLDFHHKDPKKKEMSISNMIGMGYSSERIKKEIDKCEILCSNCHRKVHNDLLAPVV